VYKRQAENGMITVVLMVNSPQGCTDSAHYHYNFQQPVIDSSAMVFVPNVFTPNGDGINGVFKPVFTAEINAYQLTIFNRWGEQVFQSNEVTEGWDGTFKGQECTDGTYTWVLQYGDTTNAFKQQLNGSVSLFR
jgi:gliding motility-associated-like protein